MNKLIKGTFGTNTILFCLTALLFIQSYGICQDNPAIQGPKLVKTMIGNSGCTASLPEGMPPFAISLSEDSSFVFSAEGEAGGQGYGCIAIKFLQPLYQASPEDLDELLSSYLKYLESYFNIILTEGQGRGHVMEGGARGIYDRWADFGEKNYHVMGWINKEYLGILYVYNPEDYPEWEESWAYLNSFRFPK